MGQGTLIGIAMIGGALLVVLIAAVKRSPALVLAAVTVFAAISWELPLTPQLVSVGGASIYPEDALLVSIMVVTVLDPRQLMSVLHGLRPLLALVLVALLLSLVTGLVLHGGAAANEFREFAYGFGLAAWAANQDWVSDSGSARIRVWAKATGLVLLVVLAFHISLYGLGEADSFVLAAGEARTGRPLVAGQAMLLACVGFLMFRDDSGTRRTDKALGCLFVAGAVLCQHRSVWAAVLVAIVLVFLHLRGQALARAVIATFYAVLAALLLMVSGLGSSVVESFEHSSSSGGTLRGRLLSWSRLLEGAFDDGWFTVLFGSPFGTGWLRVVGGEAVIYGPHNWYLSIFLRLGLVGFIAFLALLLTVLARLIRRRNLVAIAVLAALAIYCIPYAFTWYVTPLLGWAISMAGASGRAAAQTHQIRSGNETLWRSHPAPSPTGRNARGK